LAEGKSRRGWWIAGATALVLVAGLTGVAAGYGIWAEPDWYKARDPASLPASAENDLIKYGWSLVVDTPRHIGPLTADPEMRFAGNDLACSNCHLDGGLKAFAAPFVSTFASYPLMVDDNVRTLYDRINGCMTRSMNGRVLAEAGREMNALIAYIRWIGDGTPVGVRVAGMGLLPLSPSAERPSAERGEAVYKENCARCHGSAGLGDPKAPPASGWAVPPLWGDGSFNDASGMARIETAAAFIRANMPRGVSYDSPVLSEQQAFDVAAYLNSHRRPAGRPRSMDGSGSPGMIR
jgi:thiosulfate dehydrogenase